MSSTAEQAIQEEMKRIEEKLAEDNTNALQAASIETDEEWTPPTETNANDFSSYVTESAKSSHEKKVIDALLATIPQGQDYYLKLYKEIAPGKFELKERIDNYDDWTDLEWEITSIVRKNTIANPLKWGSALYKINIWKSNGIREKFKPILLHIDANEIAVNPMLQHASSPKEDMAESLSSLTNLLAAVKQISPPVQSPDQQQSSIANSFMKGMELSSSNQNNDASNNQTMILAMMEMMKANRPDPTPQMDIVKLLEVLKPQPVPTNSFETTLQTLTSLGLLGQTKAPDMIENLKTFQALGLLKNPADDDPMSKFSQFKDMLGVVQDLSGLAKGEKPSIMEKIIEVVGPKIPDMIDNVSKTVNSVVETKKLSMMQNMSAQPTIEYPTTNQPTDLSTSPHTMGINVQPDPANTIQQPIVTPEVGANPQLPIPQENNMGFMSNIVGKLYNGKLDRLYEIVLSTDYTTVMYEEVTTTLYDIMPSLVEKIASKELSSEDMCNLIAQYGGDRFLIPETKTFLDNYVSYLIDLHSNMVYATCSKCHEEYSFINKEAFESDSKTCEVCNDGETLIVTSTETDSKVNTDLNDLSIAAI